MFEPRTSEEILPSVEVVQEGPDHLVVADLGLLHLLLFHTGGHHRLHGGGPGGGDDAMAGEPTAFLMTIQSEKIPSSIHIFSIAPVAGDGLLNVPGRSKGWSLNPFNDKRTMLQGPA